MNSEPRFVLWVDAVGGYLVCLSEEVVLGQAVPGNAVDIPILGDMSCQHARIRREGEGYLIYPHSQVRVEGGEVRRARLLNDGDEIELGQSVQFRFRQPHPLSTTARLDFLTTHRTQPSADAVLLMADTCILGPAMRNHVVCRDWAGDVVLYRGADKRQLKCRAGGPIEIDGNPCETAGSITLGSRVTGSDFALGLEEL